MSLSIRASCTWLRAAEPQASRKIPSMGMRMGQSMRPAKRMWPVATERVTRAVILALVRMSRSRSSAIYSFSDTISMAFSMGSGLGGGLILSRLNSLFSLSRSSFRSSGMWGPL